MDLRDGLGARDKVCPSSWQRAQKGGSWGYLAKVRYSTILSVVSADLVGEWEKPLCSAQLVTNAKATKQLSGKDLCNLL